MAGYAASPYDDKRVLDLTVQLAHGDLTDGLAELPAAAFLAARSACEKLMEEVRGDARRQFPLKPVCEGTRRPQVTHTRRMPAQGKEEDSRFDARLLVPGEDRAHDESAAESLFGDEGVRVCDAREFLPPASFTNVKQTSAVHPLLDAAHPLLEKPRVGEGCLDLRA